MEKALKILFTLTLLSLLVPLRSVLAQGVNQCTLQYNIADFLGAPQYTGCTPNAVIDYASQQGICCLFNVVFKLTNWAFIGFLVIAIILGLVGAFQILMSGGAPDKVTAGRNLIIFAIIGAAIALGAKAIPWLVKVIVS